MQGAGDQFYFAVLGISKMEVLLWCGERTETYFDVRRSERAGEEANTWSFRKAFRAVLRIFGAKEPESVLLL